MELDVKGKTREVNFNKVGFIRKLDSIYKAESDGVEFGFGLMFADIYLKQYSVPHLSNVIRCGIKEAVRVEDVDEAIEAYAEEHGTLDGLFEQVIDELGKSPIATATLKKLENLEKKNQDKNNVANLKSIK